MEEMKKVARCYRCGAALQEEDPTKEGYLSKETKLLEGEEPLLCSTCFQEMHWNDKPKENFVSASFLKMLSFAKKKPALFVYMIDLFSFESSFVNEVSRALKEVEILVLANKRDLLPQNIDEAYLREYVALHFRKAGLSQVTAKDVYLTSVYRGFDLEPLKLKIREERKGRDIYLLGASKSGKTLLVSSFLSTYKNETGKTIAGGTYFDTESPVLRIPLDKDSYLYDTEGFNIDNSLFGHEDTPKELIVQEGETVGPSSFSLEKNGSLFLGLLAHFDLLKTERKSVPVTCFFSKKVEIKRITPKKDMGILFDKYLEKKALKPRLLSLKSSKDFDAFDFEFEKEEERDFGIAGFGWMSVKGLPGEQYRLYLPKGIGAYTSIPKIKKKRK